MMHLTIFMMILLVVLGWLVLRRAPNPITHRYRWPSTLQWIGLGILLSFAGFWAWWGFAEMATDPSGFIHLLPILPIIFLVYLGWRQPGLVGWGILALSILYLLTLNLPAFLAEPTAWSLQLRMLAPTLILVVGPLLLSGLCLLGAAHWARYYANHEPPSSDQKQIDRLDWHYHG